MGAVQLEEVEARRLAAARRGDEVRASTSSMSARVISRGTGLWGR